MKPIEFQEIIHYNTNDNTIIVIDNGNFQMSYPNKKIEKTKLLQPQVLNIASYHIISQK